MKTQRPIPPNGQDQPRELWRSSPQCPIPCSCDNCNTVNSLMDQLAIAEELTRTLRGRISASQQAINMDQDLMSSKLPLELVYHIFELFVDMQKERSKQRIHLGVQAHAFDLHRGVPLLLGAVCKRWREIAWSMPQLWTTLTIEVFSSGHAHGPDLITPWLLRAAGRPLTIQIREPEDVTASERAPCQDCARDVEKTIIYMLNKFAGQWETLDFTRVPYRMLQGLEVPRFRYPSTLRRICVGGSMSDTGRNPLMKDELVFSTAYQPHRPTHVTILRLFHPGALNISWANVTHLHIGYSSQSIFFACMRLVQDSPLTHLSVVALRRFSADSFQPASSSMFHIRYLTHLSVDGDPAGQACEIVFYHIAVPALQSLRFNANLPMSSHGVWRAPLLHPPLIDCLNGSDCELRELELFRPELRNHEVNLIFQRVPFLQVLKFEVDWRNNMTSVLDALDPARDVLPHLRTLHLAGCPSPLWEEFLFRIYGIGGDQAHPTPIPIRKDLQITISLVSPPPNTSGPGIAISLENHLLSRDGLRKIITLWDRHKISIPIVAFTHDMQPLEGFNFLERSYLQAFSGDWKDEDVFQSLKRLPSFKF